MQPTPTLSPVRKRVTAEPTALTRPMISCPGTIGYIATPQSLRDWCRSVWHTPQYRISTTTSSGRGSRRVKAKGTSGWSAAEVPYPLTSIVRPPWSGGQLTTVQDRDGADLAPSLPFSLLQVQDLRGSGLRRR